MPTAPPQKKSARRRMSIQSEPMRQGIHSLSIRILEPWPAYLNRYGHRHERLGRPGFMSPSKLGGLRPSERPPERPIRGPITRGWHTEESQWKVAFPRGSRGGMAPESGLEPETFRLGGGRSILLSYGNKYEIDRSKPRFQKRTSTD